MEVLSRMQLLAGRLIVSCQAPDGDPFRDPESIARFARAAASGGAGGLRVNGPEDIGSVRSAVSLPIIGISKRLHTDGKVLITASFEDAGQIVRAGADIVAIDCTDRGRRLGALERLRRIRAELRVPVMADIATLAEALAAVAAGADIVGSTMRGYTDETASVRVFEPDFIARLAALVTVPIIAEGRVETPAQAAEAIRAGAYAVVVGAAITRPKTITSRFALALQGQRAGTQSRDYVLGVDLGATNTKAGIVSSDGTLTSEFVVPTPRDAREGLMTHLDSVVQRGLDTAKRSGINPGMLGIGTAGWVDHHAGRVVYATGNLSGWTGAPIADHLRASTGLCVAVENDAHALAIAERAFGAGRGVDDFVCLTLGTGVGGSCYSGGRLIRGAHGMGGALGHIAIHHNGLACSCGLQDCLEVYANAAALLRYAGNGFRTPESVIQAAHCGEQLASEALSTYAGHLAAGIVSIMHLLDPKLLIISGGLAQDNRFLFTSLERELGNRLLAGPKREVQVQPSPLGYYGGVLGAAAAALERLVEGRIVVRDIRQVAVVEPVVPTE